MYNQLYQYFIQHKKLDVPGIGTFLLDKTPAVFDFPNKLINAPFYTVSLRHPATAPPKKFFTWLAHILNITDREAVIHFNDFAFELKKKINDDATISWNGLGVLTRGLAGEIKFTTDKGLTLNNDPIKAEKIIRDKAEHMVRVGEDERTSAEMTEMLNQPVSKKMYWWAYPLITGVVALIFIGWYFSEHGMSVMTLSNVAGSTPLENPSTYRILP